MSKSKEEHRSDCELSNKDLIERCLASMSSTVKKEKPTRTSSDTRRRIEDIQMRSDLDKLELAEQEWADNG